MTLAVTMTKILRLTMILQQAVRVSLLSSRMMTASLRLKVAVTVTQASIDSDRSHGIFARAAFITPMRRT